jgi:hypothetical protein
MLYRIPRLWFLEEIKLSGYIKSSEGNIMKSIVSLAYTTGSFTTTVLRVATYNFSYFVFDLCQHVFRERCTLRMESVCSSDPTTPTYLNTIVVINKNKTFSCVVFRMSHRTSDFSPQTCVRITWKSQTNLPKKISPHFERP